ncbi:MAG: hypothetical protein V4587_15760 [Acidobacteriota bacterium]
MPSRLKFGALLTFVVAILFWAFFDISKHNPLFSQANAFAEDPYDAIGSFGIQAAAVLAVLSLVRAFWAYAEKTVPREQQALLVRTQMLAILAIAITLAGDSIAMARHTAMWLPSRGGHVLFGLLVGMILVTAGAGVFLYRAPADIPLRKTASALKRAGMVSAVAVLILAFYPESLRGTIPGELFTVLVGDILLFIPLALLGMALVPEQGKIDFQDPVRFACGMMKKYQWWSILLVGMVIGLSLAVAELREPSGWPPLSSKVVLVFTVFIALETSGMLLGYAFLRKPLGLS